MMAAVQPFISGAISKTINMPEDSTAEDILNAYLESWRLGLKAVAIYRDGSKRVQPVSASESKAEKRAAAPAVAEKIVYRPVRRKLPDERASVTHKFSIAGTKATSRWASTRTALPASCSSPWPRRDRPSPA